MPLIAAPIAAPIIAASEIGASIILLEPNSSKKPFVSLKAPPYVPISSPIIKTDSSVRICIFNASAIASSVFQAKATPILRNVLVIGLPKILISVL